MIRCKLYREKIDGVHLWGLGVLAAPYAWIGAGLLLVTVLYAVTA